jgi:AcrR family transcriptional regulator
MNDARMPIGRCERAKQDKRDRSMAAARELFAEHGVGEVTTQQVADRADAAIDTLYPYASTKAELLIMVQNKRFAAAIDTGLAAAAVTARRGPLEGRHRAHPPSGGRVCVSRSRTDAPICTSSSSGILRALPSRGTRPLSPTRGRHRAPADTRRAHRRPRCPTCRQCSQSSHMCRLTAVRRSSRRTRSQDRDGATTCGTCRAPTG